jgi:hypothetical protein
MLAVAQALEDGGASVCLAGGGPGSKFIALNGYDQYEPATVDYIDDFQDGGNLLRVLTNSVPISAKRVVDYVRWLRREDPDALVTDDMFAAMAAPFARVPLYVLTHNAPGFYEERVEEWFTWLLTELQLEVGREFFYPSVWPTAPEDPGGVTPIPPVALEDQGRRDARQRTDGAGVAADAAGLDADDPETGDVGALLVPSHYSEGFDDLAAALADAGETVTLVGGDDWEPVPAMLPLVRRADVVVCSGYSTVMEAAVAGTPCVIYPFTDEQRGVARVIEESDATGFRVVDSRHELREAVANPPAAPEYENGAPVAADAILADL